MDSCTLPIKLKPRAKGNRISPGTDGSFVIAVTSPPIDNKANEHLIKLLSECLSVPKANIRIIKGGHSHNKVVAIDGLSSDIVVSKLQGFFGGNKV